MHNGNAKHTGPKATERLKEKAQRVPQSTITEAERGVSEKTLHKERRYAPLDSRRAEKGSEIRIGREKRPRC